MELESDVLYRDISPSFPRRHSSNPLQAPSDRDRNEDSHHTTLLRHRDVCALITPLIKLLYTPLVLV